MYMCGVCVHACVRACMPYCVVMFVCVHAQQAPDSYLSLNWPISYSCVDQDGRCLAVAGKAGVALYSSLNHKWKLFSNEQQEQSVVCRGGLAWWNDIVVFPCVVSCSNVEVREGEGEKGEGMGSESESGREGREEEGEDGGKEEEGEKEEGEQGEGMGGESEEEGKRRGRGVWREGGGEEVRVWKGEREEWLCFIYQHQEVMMIWPFFLYYFCLCATLLDLFSVSLLCGLFFPHTPSPFLLSSLTLSSRFDSTHYTRNWTVHSCCTP